MLVLYESFAKVFEFRLGMRGHNGSVGEGGLVVVIFGDTLTPGAINIMKMGEF